MKRSTLLPMGALLLVLILAALYPRERPRQPALPAVSSTPPPVFPTASPLPSPSPTRPAVVCLSPAGCSTPTPYVITPYPTARAIKPGAIAFASNDWEHSGPSSLWIANTDGSGERQLVSKLEKSQRTFMRNDFMLKWSPDGKWLSFLSIDDLWVASRDGTLVKKVLSFPDEQQGLLYTYCWSPDGSKIAYVQAAIGDANPRHALVGTLDVSSGELSGSFEFEFPYTVSVTWLPDGKSLLLNGRNYFALVDPISGKIIQETPPCGQGLACAVPTYFDSLILAPSGRWFALTEHGNGIGGHPYFLIAGTDGSFRFINQAASAGPIWDAAGDVAYFISADIQPWAHGDYDPHGRLMRFNARTRELQLVMPLETKQHGVYWPLSISPDGQKLELHAATRDKKETFIVVKDLHAFSSIQYTIDLQAQVGQVFGNAWTSDSNSLIFFAGRNQTPFVCSHGCWSYGEPYGSFYRMNILTGRTELVSAAHQVTEWLVSPSSASP